MSQTPRPDDAQVKFLQQQLGLKILQLRETRGWSQDTLAHLVGMGRSYPYRVESGQVDMRLSTLARLAHAFSLPITELLTLGEVEQPTVLTKAVRVSPKKTRQRD